MKASAILLCSSFPLTFLPSVDLPFHPALYRVVKVEGAGVAIQRGEMVKTRNLSRLKLVKERPSCLAAKGKEKNQEPEFNEEDN